MKKMLLDGIEQFLNVISGLVNPIRENFINLFFDGLKRSFPNNKIERPVTVRHVLGFAAASISLWLVREDERKEELSIPRRFLTCRTAPSHRDNQKRQAPC